MRRGEERRARSLSVPLQTAASTAGFIEANREANAPNHELAKKSRMWPGKSTCTTTKQLLEAEDNGKHILTAEKSHCPAKRERNPAVKGKGDEVERGE